MSRSGDATPSRGASSNHATPGTAASAADGVATATDSQLIARHVAGDPEAFAELVRRHRDRLWAVAVRTLGNNEDAADALQDALLSAHRAAGRFRGDSAVTTWLHRIVVNACLDLARRRAVRPTEPLDPELTADVGRDDIGDRETGLVVLEALRTLPVEQAAALVLVDIEGYSVAEASDILDVPQGTVKSRCARGRARLAGILSPLEAGARRDGTTTDAPAASVADQPRGNEAATPRVPSSSPLDNEWPAANPSTDLSPDESGQEPR